MLSRTPLRPVGLLAVCTCAAACSDYNFSPKGNENRGSSETATTGEGPYGSGMPDSGDTDDGPPSGADTCEDASPGTLPSPIIDSSCVVSTSSGVFEPTVEWQWTTNPDQPGYDQIMSSPMVANLTDDNGDGIIDTSDIPDIVFTSFAGDAYR